MPRKKPKARSTTKPTTTAETTLTTVPQARPTTEPILYWQDILVHDEYIKARYINVFLKLKAAMYKEVKLDLKKMKGHEVYTVYAENDSDRLLFTTIVIKGIRYLFFLELIDDHNYEGSRFLNEPAVLKRFKEKKTAEISAKGFENLKISLNLESVDSQELSSKEKVSTEGQSSERLKFDGLFEEVKEWPKELRDALQGTGEVKLIPTESYHQQYIVLNPEQNQVLITKPPCFLSGPPGSGKTCMALLLAKNAAPHLKVLCIANSKNIVKDLKENWYSLPEAFEPRQGSVHFLSYVEWLHEVDKTTRERAIVGYEEFATWFASYPKNKGWEPSEIYHEFRIAAAHTREEYTKLGGRQSLISPEARHWIYKVYEAYVLELEERKVEIRLEREVEVEIDGKIQIKLEKVIEEKYRLDPSLYVVKSIQEVDLVIVDEGEDLSCQQWKHVVDCSRGKFYGCGDFLQTTTDSLPSHAFVNRYLFQKGYPTLEYIYLPFSYRIFEKALPLVNNLLDLRREAIGGSVNKGEFTELTVHVDESLALGSVHWIDDWSPEFIKEKFSPALNTPHFAVVTWPEYFAQAKALFSQTSLVYTIDGFIDGIKGLEYSGIIIFCPFEPHFWEEINTFLQMKHKAQGGSFPSSSSSSSSKASRPAKGEAHFKFASAFGNVFTMMTRAQREIFIFQKLKPEISLLTEKLGAKNFLGRDFSFDLEEKMGSEEEWLKEIERHIRQEKITKAEGIFIKKLNKNKDEFRAFLALINQEKTGEIKASADLQKDASSQKVEAEPLVPLVAKKKELPEVTPQKPRLKPRKLALDLEAEDTPKVKEEKQGQRQARKGRGGRASQVTLPKMVEKKPSSNKLIEVSKIRAKASDSLPPAKIVADKRVSSTGFFSSSAKEKMVEKTFVEDLNFPSMKPIARSIDKARLNIAEVMLSLDRAESRSLSGATPLSEEVLIHNLCQVSDPCSYLFTVLDENPAQNRLILSTLQDNSELLNFLKPKMSLGALCRQGTECFSRKESVSLSLFDLLCIPYDAVNHELFLVLFNSNDYLQQQLKSEVEWQLGERALIIHPGVEAIEFNFKNLGFLTTTVVGRKMLQSLREKDRDKTCIVQDVTRKLSPFYRSYKEQQRLNLQEEFSDAFLSLGFCLINEPESLTRKLVEIQPRLSGSESYFCLSYAFNLFSWIKCRWREYKVTHLQFGSLFTGTISPQLRLTEKLSREVSCLEEKLSRIFNFEQEIECLQEEINKRSCNGFTLVLASLCQLLKLEQVMRAGLKPAMKKEELINMADQSQGNYYRLSLAVEILKVRLKSVESFWADLEAKWDQGIQASLQESGSLSLEMQGLNFSQTFKKFPALVLIKILERSHGGFLEETKREEIILYGQVLGYLHADIRRPLAEVVCYFIRLNLSSIDSLSSLAVGLNYYKELLFQEVRLQRMEAQNVLKEEEESSSCQLSLK